MNLSEAIRARHSVRQYKNKPLEQEKISLCRRKLTDATVKAAFIFSL